MIHPAFEKWFGISVTPESEFSARRDAGDLRAMTEEAARELKPKGLVDLLPQLVQERVDTVRKQMAGKDPAEQRRVLRAAWSRVLGPMTPAQEPKTVPQHRKAVDVPGASVERIVLEVEPGIVVPLLLISGLNDAGRRPPIVVAVAQSGKEDFLRQRADDIARLVTSGMAVCLPDLRGTGETRTGDDRGQTSSDTSRSSTELMLGGTMLGARLRDLRSVLHYLRSRDALDSGRIALWGDSFAPVNTNEANLRAPHRITGRPHQAEPLGGLLALLGGLFDEGIHTVYVSGGLADLQSVMQSQFVSIPHDVVVPGALTAGDLCDIAAALTPRPLCLEGLVDAQNRRLSPEAVRETYRPATAAYRRAAAERDIAVGGLQPKPANWLTQSTQ
jgi:hypothetical protein